MTVDELIERSHAMAVEKGWWPDGPGKRPVAEIVNNLHAEISEACEEYRAGRIETWWSCWEFPGVAVELHPGCDKTSNEDGRTLRCFRLPGAGCQLQWEHEANGQFLKPEGFFVEIADLCIRLGDAMGAMGWWSFEINQAAVKDLPLFVSWLHEWVNALSSGMGWSYGADLLSSVVISACLDCSEFHGVGLLSLCELKMAYNATRPIRHGGKLA